MGEALPRVVILGANGQIARHTIQILEQSKDIELVLMARHGEFKPDSAKIVYGDVNDMAVLTRVIADADVVFANLGPNHMVEMAQHVSRAMQINHVSRLIWMSTAGIYDEFSPLRRARAHMMWGDPSNTGSPIGDQLLATRLLEEDGLNVTIIRPNWLTDGPATGHLRIGKRSEQVPKGQVSRADVGQFVAELIVNPTQFTYDSVSLTNGTDET